jgi:hypothetical protein
MKKLFIILLVAGLGFTNSSCETLLALATEIEKAAETTETELPLTKEEVAKGLKEALRVSTDTAVSIVSVKDGFYGDAALKILLPPEAKIIMDHKDDKILKAIGISKMIDDVIVRLNRSAEDATKQAGPIFLNAIKGMSITDAFEILNGGETAATEYFKKNTSNQLRNAFKPVIKSSLDKPLVGNISTTKAWNDLTTAYNKVAKYSNTLTPVNTNLEDYVTQRAMDGLFLKLAEEEKQIRKDPVAQVTDILKRVFGS